MKFLIATFLLCFSVVSFAKSTIVGGANAKILRNALGSAGAKREMRPLGSASKLAVTKLSCEYEKKHSQARCRFEQNGKAYYSDTLEGKDIFGVLKTKVKVNEDKDSKVIQVDSITCLTSSGRTPTTTCHIVY
jgi:hypothetical protein